jgi:hypothetical protein
MPSPPALAALLAALRPASMPGRTLATLADGLALLELQQQRLAARSALQAQLGLARGSGAAARAARRELDRARDQASPSLVPPPLLDALLQRAEQELPSLQPFEYARLVGGMAQLRCRAARRLLLQGPGSGRAHPLLLAAMKYARLPDVVALAWAMATWRCCPDPALPRLAARLQHTSPSYRLGPAALAQLGEALAALPPRQAALLTRHPSPLLEAAAAAAEADAAALAGEALAAASGSPASSASGSQETGAAGRTPLSASPSHGGRPDLVRQTRQQDVAAAADGWGGAAVGAAAVSAAVPAADSEEAERPLNATFDFEVDSD